MSNTKDPRQPGPLLRSETERFIQPRIVARITDIGSPSPEAARRIAERVNLAWAQAWADELASAPVAMKPDSDLSPWFPGEQAPWEPGVYERRVCSLGRPLGLDAKAGFARWDGNVWYPIFKRIEDTENWPDASGFQLDNDSVWRGISEAQARALGML